MGTTQLPAREARLAAGFDLYTAAKRLGITPGYLSQLERYGQWKCSLAEDARKLYGCKIDAFFNPPGREGTRKQQQARRGATPSPRRREAVSHPQD